MRFHVTIIPNWITESTRKKNRPIDAFAATGKPISAASLPSQAASLRLNFLNRRHDFWVLPEVEQHLQDESQYTPTHAALLAKPRLQCNSGYDEIYWAECPRQ